MNKTVRQGSWLVSKPQIYLQWISDLPGAMDEHIVRGIPVFKLSVGLCVCVVGWGDKCVHVFVWVRVYKNTHHRKIVCVCVFTFIRTLLHLSCTIISFYPQRSLGLSNNTSARQWLETHRQKIHHGTVHTQYCVPQMVCKRFVTKI